MHLHIAYLYPEIMNIYGDRGNIITLFNRCLWRGIKVFITNISLNQKIEPEKIDLFFGGGGQDRQQLLVAKDLKKKKEDIAKAVEARKVFLLICGTYQLFGHYFLTSENKKIPGIGILDIKTIAGKKRKIGNTVVQLPVNTLVGFENHSGNTFIKVPSSKFQVPSNTSPLGKVIKGFGNNGKDRTEGAVFKNVYGTYLHGPLLPKNPHFADYLIKTALEVKYKKTIKLKPLDDSLEWQAHEYISRKA